MPIERKDRSFDLIFDQVSMDVMPAEYIIEIYLSLIDGSKLTITRDELSMIEGGSSNVMSAIAREDLMDVQVKLDYEAIKRDVVTGVGDYLGKYFNN